MNRLIKLVLVSVGPFQPSILLVRKGGAYLSESPFRCSTLGLTAVLTNKNKTRLFGTNTY